MSRSRISILISIVTKPFELYHNVEHLFSDHNFAQRSGGGHDVGGLHAGGALVRRPHVHHPRRPGGHELQALQVGDQPPRQQGDLHPVQRHHLLRDGGVQERQHDLPVHLSGRVTYGIPEEKMYFY